MPIQAFLETTREIKQNIAKINQHTDELLHLTRKKQNSILNKEEEMDLDRKIEAANRILRDLGDKTKAMIQVHQREIEDMIDRRDDPGEIELRKGHTLSHTKELKNALERYQNVECEYQEREHEKLRESFLIARPSATSEELDKLVDPTEGDAMLESAFALGSHSAKRMLKETQDRKKKMNGIMKTVAAIVALMREVDNIAKNQTSEIDRITVNMASAVEHTEGTRTELRRALEYERRVQRIKRYIVFGIIFIIVIFLLFLLSDVVFRRPRRYD